MVVVGLILLGLLLVTMYMTSPSIEHYDTNTYYSDIKPSLKTGDVIMFSGNRLDMYIIRFLTRCPVVHCGIVFVDSVANEGGKLFNTTSHTDDYYIFESTPHALHDVMTNEFDRNGVALVPLDDKINDYYTFNFALLRLSHTVNHNDFVKALYRYRGMGFTYNIWSWRSALFRTRHDTRSHTTTKFCSELIGDVYRDLGLMEYDGYMVSPSFIYNNTRLFTERIIFKKQY
uniref:Permuted papain-like amidase YaeF/Yiix C92 family enzyme n=1 Tax=viral metagenome TaxID=1070528 RepID=A0A6C0LXK2_9ZZZZ